MKASRDFRSRVRAVQKKIDLLSSESKVVSANLRKKSAEAEDLWEVMNFRERYLAGWFGGDKVKVRNHIRMEGESASLKRKLLRLKAKSEKLDGKLMEYVSGWLFRNDVVFRDIHEARMAAEKMKKSADLFAEKIDRALSEIDEAQGMETLDLVTKNKGISFLSYMENSQANDAIGAVNRGAGTFQKSLAEYNQFLKGRKSFGMIVRVDDGFDLMMDVIFDGFDFSSLFTLSALNNAESQLQEARLKITKVQSSVNGSFRKAKAVEVAYLKKVRSGCLN